MDRKVKTRILNAMLTGARLTPMMANEIGITTAGTRVIRKIRENYPVRSEKVAGELYHRYWIDEAFLMNYKRQSNMSNLNKAFLIGRVGKNPEIKDINGTKCATFSLATGRKYKDRNGNMQEITQWHNIVAWRVTAEVCEKYVRQGEQLYVEGEITYRSWETDRGEKRYATDIVASNIQLLGSRGASSEVMNDDDLPE